MYGAQGPGGPRGGIAPGRGRSGREVYVRRRILAVLIVVLLLALLVPRACQAFFGSKEDTGPREERRAGAPETAAPEKATEAGVGGDTDTGTGKAGTKDASSGRGAPFIKGEAGSEGASRAEAATDLTAMIVGPAVIGGGESSAVEDAAGGGSSADQTAQSPAGPSLVAGLQASRQPATGPQNAAETPRAPAERPPSDNRGAPTSQQSVGPSGTAAPVTNPPRERVRGGGDRVATAPIAARSQFGGVQARPPEPVAIEPVPTAPVVNAPVAAAPTAVPSDTTFVAGDTSVAGGTGGVATNFGRNAVGGTINDAAAFNRAARGTPAVIGARPARAALSGGPRLAAAGPIRTPRSALF
jgi:hypothetical protein